MRPALVIGIMSCLLGGANSALADPEPYNAIIRVPEVQVLSGPSSTGYYPTSLLRRGEEVRVMKEEDGWLAIVPPADSFSWVKDLFVSKIDPVANTATVRETAEVRVGSALNPDKRNVTKVKISPGSLIVILDDKPAYGEDGAWIKIQPPTNEYRYIPADAIQPPAPKVQTVSPPPSGPPPALGSPTSTQAPPAGDSLWYRAEQAERAGNPAEAERLFLQLAHETPDHDLQMRCYNRIHFLREGRRTSYPTGYQPGRPSDSSYTNNYGQNRLVPSPGYPGNPYMTASRATSQYTYAPVPPAGKTPPVTSTANSAGNCQWSGWGWLRRAPFFVDNKQAYVLENSQGMPRLYVTAQPGVNMESYVNRTVNLYGKMMYRGDLRTNYMTACQLTPLP
jgi:hypothetical protein